MENDRTLLVKEAKRLRRELLARFGGSEREALAAACIELAQVSAMWRQVEEGLVASGVLADGEPIMRQALEELGS